MITIDKLPNGLTVIVEEMQHVASAAYELAIPGGIVCDQQARQGLSLILAELTSRGAGDLDSRALSDKFDGLGIRHSEFGGQDRFSYRGSLLAEHLDSALWLVSLMVQKPKLAESEIENIKSVLLQDIAALEDNPARKVMEELVKRYYPAPYERSSLGDAEGLRSSSYKEITDAWSKIFRPEGAVLSVAGKVTRTDVIKSVERHFSSWSGKALAKPAFAKMPALERAHVPFASSQLQIALASPSAKFGHPLYYPAKVATTILSGGMFGRLFVEVREKRGLCYSVYARHTGNEFHGTMLVYAGTTPERAAETLEVIIQELGKVRETVTPDELTRAKINLKTNLVMGEESPSSRAASNASDWWVGGRVRTLQEIDAAISAVTAKDVDKFVEEFPAVKHTLLTLGAKDIFDARSTSSRN